jgi:hypothetical protein
LLLLLFAASVPAIEAGKVNTVLGLVAAENLGFTLRMSISPLLTPVGLPMKPLRLMT